MSVLLEIFETLTILGKRSSHDFKSFSVLSLCRFDYENVSKLTSKPHVFLELKKLISRARKIKFETCRKFHEQFLAKLNPCIVATTGETSSKIIRAERKKFLL